MERIMSKGQFLDRFRREKEMRRDLAAAKIEQDNADAQRLAYRVATDYEFERRERRKKMMRRYKRQ